VLLHGFGESWRSWELALPALERRHDVLALTLPGHAGGPPLQDELADGVERALDDAGIELAHIAGNSLGGYVALQLAARGRARGVVALAPAGGWADDAYEPLLRMQLELHEQTSAAHAEALVATPAGRRRVTRLLTVGYEHIPAELLAHTVRAMAGCDAPALIERGLRGGWRVEPEKIACPVRFVWGTEDRLLPWPSAAARYRTGFPHADWVVLDGVGHSPQLDVPLEAAQLIVDFG
jgi:pimeloyl-ACP methyl ester carboxylesterase